MGVTKLIVFLCMVLYAYCRPATNCDLSSITSLVNTLEYRRNTLLNEIKQIKSWHASIEDQLANAWKEYNHTDGWVVPEINNRHGRLSGYEIERFNSYVSNRKGRYSSAISHNFDDHYDDELYPAYKNTTKTDWNLIYYDIYKSVRNISKQNSWSMHKARKKNLEEYKKEVTAAKMKTQNDLHGIGDGLYLVSRQVQLQQFNEYEKARSDGNTGIKQIRTFRIGSKNYHSNDHNGYSIAGIRDQADMKDQLGIGEIVAVMNGIEFRTNERTYELKTPVLNDKTFHKTTPVIFPSVPNSVSQITDHDMQITEMRKWFDAFQKQDDSVYDYHSYFKPVLTYLEGAWLTDEVNEIQSDLNHYTSFTGLPGDDPYLPSKIMGFSDSKKPLYSTWNYRFLCHPLQSDLPTSYLKMIYDPVSMRRHQWADTMYRPTAKFDLQGLKVDGSRREPGEERPIYYTFLDALMEEVAGKDNYGASITANGFDASILSAHPDRESQSLNGAHYHRPYKLSSADAMGIDTAQRSYSDILYVALTTQNKVSGPVHQDGDDEIHIRASYSIPMEIIYLNPLHEWNPFDIPHEDNCNDISGTGSLLEPFSATCPSRYFLTPQAFFTGGSITECDVTDPNEAFYFTAPNHPASSPVCLVASGVRIMLPLIAGREVPIRQRYPIMPINGEGSFVWKKLNAIEDSLNLSGEIIPDMVTYRTGISNHIAIPAHYHEIVITVDERDALMDGTIPLIKKPTEADGMHQHILTLKKKTLPDGTETIVVDSCNSDTDPPNPANRVCFDSHVNTLE